MAARPAVFMLALLAPSLSAGCASEAPGPFDDAWLHGEPNECFDGWMRPHLRWLREVGTWAVPMLHLEQARTAGRMSQESLIVEQRDIFDEFEEATNATVGPWYFDPLFDPCGPNVDTELWQITKDAHDSYKLGLLRFERCFADDHELSCAVARDHFEEGDLAVRLAAEEVERLHERYT